MALLRCNIGTLATFTPCHLVPQVDSFIPTPLRETEKDFIMPGACHGFGQISHLCHHALCVP